MRGISFAITWLVDELRHSSDFPIFRKLRVNHGDNYGWKHRRPRFSILLCSQSLAVVSNKVLAVARCDMERRTLHCSNISDPIRLTLD